MTSKPNATPVTPTGHDESPANSLSRRAYCKPALTRIMVAEATETSQKKSGDGMVGKGS